MSKISERNLYLVLSEECCKGRSAPEVAKLAISGGVTMLQMREKAMPRAELVRLGCELRLICKKGREGKIGGEKGDVIFIVNDDPAIAKEVDADGVHLGQEDLEKYGLENVRKLIGLEKIIGVSTHSLEQFKKVNEEDFDYVAFGPIFPTKTKDYFIGTTDVEKVLAVAEKPVVFIGGINLENVGELLEKGAENIALIRGITEAEDVETAARNFKTRVNKGEKGMRIRVKGGREGEIGEDKGREGNIE